MTEYDLKTVALREVNRALHAPDVASPVVISPTS